MTTVRYGLRIPSFALGPETATLEEMGRYPGRAEDLGFDAAVTIDHLPLTPPAYACTWPEPIALLSALAGVTRTIKLGTTAASTPSCSTRSPWGVEQLERIAGEVLPRVKS